MSKRKSHKRSKPAKTKNNRHSPFIEIGLALILIASSAALAQWKLLWPSAQKRSEQQSDTQKQVKKQSGEITTASLDPQSPSKEYIYAGGRLVATEEPASGTGTPAAPSGLTATAQSSSQINLIWADNSSNETGFEIDRATNSSFSANLVTTTVGSNVTSHPDTGLSASTTYYYRVRAFNGTNFSGYSNVANATTLPPSGSSDLIAHWKLDETSGLTASDSSTYANNGTLQGGPTWTTGKVAGGLNFDGVDDKVLVNNSSSLNPTSAITIAAWFKPQYTGNYQFLVSKFNHNSGPAGNPADDSYCLGIYPGGNLYWQLATNVGGVVTNNILTATPAASVFDPPQFHHIAATYDGATMKVYINGALLGSINVTGPIVSTSTPVYLGASLNNSAPWFFQKGVLDDARIYNRALSASEIQGLVGNTPPTVSITSPAN